MKKLHVAKHSCSLCVVNNSSYDTGANGRQISQQINYDAMKWTVTASALPSWKERVATVHCGTCHQRCCSAQRRGLQRILHDVQCRVSHVGADGHERRSLHSSMYRRCLPIYAIAAANLSAAATVATALQVITRTAALMTSSRRPPEDLDVRQCLSSTRPMLLPNAAREAAQKQ